VIRRKYIVLLLLTLISILLAGLLYSNVVQAQTTVTSYVSVSAAAFVPVKSTTNFDNWGYFLMNNDAITRLFEGSVQLPNGATVTKVTFYWYDIGTGDILLYLYRYNEAGNLEMAYMASSGTPGIGSSYDKTIDYATVDNSRYAYYLEVYIPASATHTDYLYYHAVIEYTLPSGAVGGLYIPVDKFSLLAPYITLTLTMILAISITGAYIKYRKKQ